MHIMVDLSTEKVYGIYTCWDGAQTAQRSHIVDSSRALQFAFQTCHKAIFQSLLIHPIISRENLQYKTNHLKKFRLILACRSCESDKLCYRSCAYNDSLNKF